MFDQTEVRSGIPSYYILRFYSAWEVGPLCNLIVFWKVCDYFVIFCSVEDVVESRSAGKLRLNLFPKTKQLLKNQNPSLGFTLTIFFIILNFLIPGDFESFTSVIAVVQLYISVHAFEPQENTYF